MKNIFVSLAFLVTGFLASTTHAAQGGADVNVVRVLTDAAQYGRCAIKLSSSLNGIDGLNCPGEWVSFACNGLGGIDPAEAKRMFNVAQLAMVTGRQAFIVVLDSLPKQDGMCVVRRADLI